MFRVQDLDNGYWVVKYDDGELSPAAEHKKDATIFEGDHWLEYWQGKAGARVVPLAEDEILARLNQDGLTFEKPKKYNIRTGDMWVAAFNPPKVGIQVTARRSEAKEFTEQDLASWPILPDFEIVEVLNPFGLTGKVTAPRLEGF